MAIACNVCEGTGFVNLHQIPADELDSMADDLVNKVPCWIKLHDDTDVSVCHCCGDGDVWYGEPGQHYGADDPSGSRGPYAYNGGLCKCH